MIHLSIRFGPRQSLIIAVIIIMLEYNTNNNNNNNNTNNVRTMHVITIMINKCENQMKAPHHVTSAFSGFSSYAIHFGEGPKTQAQALGSKL